MTGQLFLAPCSNPNAQRHFNDTVLEGVEIREFRDLIPDHITGRVGIWGTVRANEGSFRHMESGDFVLFYAGDRTYSHAARVIETQENPELDAALWEPYAERLQGDARDSWPLVMYLEEIRPVNISSIRLHDDLGRKDEFPLGFTRVVSGLDRIIADAGSLEAYLDRVGSTATTATDGDSTIDMQMGPRGEQAASITAVKELSDEELHRRAQAAARQTVDGTDRTSTYYPRSQLIREYARRRADGTCEACGDDAPFETTQGEPYLEVHHLEELHDAGADDPELVAAICPNCHRRIHYGVDGNEYNRRLAADLGVTLESSAG